MDRVIPAEIVFPSATSLQSSIDWAAAAAQLPALALVLLGFGVFVAALFTKKLYLGSYVQELSDACEKRLAEKDAEIAALKVENSDQHRDAVRHVAEMSRVTDNYNRLLREIVIAKLTGGKDEA